MDAGDVGVAGGAGGDEGGFGDEEGAGNGDPLGVVFGGDGELDVGIVGAEAGEGGHDETVLEVQVAYTKGSGKRRHCDRDEIV